MQSCWENSVNSATRSQWVKGVGAAYGNGYFVTVLLHSLITKSFPSSFSEDTAGGNTV